ncbi:MAG: metal-dependent phosphohydrolase, partial [Candidatus Eisenbacteria bacterium]
MSSAPRPSSANSSPDLRLVPDAQSEAVGVSEVLAALSFALDLTEGQPFGHALRSCLIGMALAGKIGLPLQDRRDLYYAILLKDVGCSSNAARVHELFGGDDRRAKRDLKRVDWSRFADAAKYALAHVAPGHTWLERARRLASLAGAGPNAVGPAVAEAVRSIDEHWNGRGEPRGLRAGQIPILARILCLAQTLEVFSMSESPGTALAIAKARRGSWFDPTLVEAASTLEPELTKWAALDDRRLQEAVRAVEPGDAVLLAGPGALDRIASAFAAVVDAKSPFTADHSRRVTELVVKVAETLGLDRDERTALRR